MNVDKYYAHIDRSKFERTSMGSVGLKHIRLYDSCVDRSRVEFAKLNEAVGKDSDIKVILGSSVEELLHGALRDPKIVEVIISENNLKKIGDKAFAGSSIFSITIPESVEEIGTNVFDGCKYLTEIINLSKNIEITPEIVGNCPKIKFENGKIKFPENEFTGFKR